MTPNKINDVSQQILDAGSAGLWSQLDAHFAKRLALDPTDVSSLGKWALSLRQRGSLAAAADLYEKLAELEPADPSHAFLRDTLRGHCSSVSFPEGAMKPAPYMVRDGLLNAGERQRLLDMLSENQAELETLGVFYDGKPGQSSTNGVDFNLRNQLGLTRLKALQDIVKPHVTRLQNAIFNALDITPFAGGIHQLRLDVTPQGGFGAMHRDATAADNMKYAYLYYFHRHPKVFSPP